MPKLLEKLAFLFKLATFSDQWDLMDEKEREDYLTESDRRRFGTLSIPELKRIIERGRKKELDWASRLMTEEEFNNLDPISKRRILHNRKQVYSGQPIQIVVISKGPIWEIYVDGEKVAFGNSEREALIRAAGIFWSA